MDNQSRLRLRLVDGWMFDRSRGAAGAVVLVIVLGSVFAFTAVGRAASPPAQYFLSASAEGVQASVIPQGYQTTFPGLASVTTPSAQASLDVALGESSGFASNPYPGATVVTAPAVSRHVR